ncbi:MAG: trehalose-phosphatase [Rhizomicrobium sp.]
MALANIVQTELTPPQPQSHWALFLDIDGTLIDLAATPADVVIPPELAMLLRGAQGALDGALALVSGRTIAMIDAVLAPMALILPCAGEHGAILRLSDGSLHIPPDSYKISQELYDAACAATQGWAGVIVEQKNFGLTLHYRQAPAHARNVHALAERLLQKAPPGFEVLPASMALELRHCALNKGYAVERFMTQPPFMGRMPVFVGDDLTDEDGMRAASRLGGFGLQVGRDFGGRTENVRRWLATIGSIQKG